MEDLNTYYKLNPDVIFTYLDDEAVLMKPDGHEMYGLSAAGAEIWKELEQKPMTKDELISKLSNSYAVEDSELTFDVNHFIDELLGERFICETMG